MSLIKFYVTPVLTLIVAAGILAGGHWLWLGIGLIVTVMVGGDALLGKDFKLPNSRYPKLLEAPLFLALPILTFLLATLAWSAADQDFLGLGAIVQCLTGFDILAYRIQNSAFDYLGAIFGVGLIVAGYGTNSAHELTHQFTKKFHYTVGRWLLSMSANADFAIEHVFGHHVHVATKIDPATALRGENVYSFFLRSTVGGHVSAWKIEFRRLERKKLSPLSLSNQMLTGYLMTLAWVTFFYAVARETGVVLFVLQAAFAKFILEVVNYIEHYGLMRTPKEGVKPQHSWNSNRRMSFMILYSLVRHSAHHETAKVPFWKLNPYPNAPEMPQGYLTTIFICLIPPLWFRVMKPKLEQWDAQYSQSTH